RRVLIDAPLSPIIPVHPRNSPVSLIIPVHTQKQGGGALKQLSATSNQRSGGKNKADPVHHSIPGGSNRLEEEWPASEGGPYTNRELSAVNCKPAFLTPAFTTTSIDIVGAAGDVEKLLALHDEMRHATQRRGKPLRQAEGMIACGHAATYDQASLARLRLFEDKGPSDLIPAVGQAPGKNQAVFRLTLCNDKHVLRAGERREHAAHTDVLQVGEDAFGAVVSAVINEVVGIPPGAAGAHLHQPRPDLARRATHGDCVMHRADRLRNQIVSGKGADALGGSGADLEAGISCERGEEEKHGEKGEE